LGDIGREKVIPPLVEKVRQGVKAWRDSGYAGGTDTTRAAALVVRGRAHCSAGGRNGAAIPLVLRAARGGGVRNLAL
jgi:hypothetical protein